MLINLGNIASPSHFRGVWASPAPRREAPRGRTTPRLPWNDWGKMLLACTCVTSHATYKKKAGRDGILTRSVSLIFAILTRSLKRRGSIWAAGGLISQSALVIPQQPPRDMREAGFLSLIPSPYAKRPEKRWLCTRRSPFCWEKRVAVEAFLLVMAPFRTEAVLTVLHRNDPPWPRLDLDSAVSNSPPRATRSCALCNDQILEMKVEWTSHAHAMKHGREAVIDRENERARTQWVPLILKRNLKLLLPGGSLAMVNPPVYAPVQLTFTWEYDHSQKIFTYRLESVVSSRPSKSFDQLAAL